MASSATAPYGFVPFWFQKTPTVRMSFSLFLPLSLSFSLTFFLVLSFTLILALSFSIYLSTYLHSTAQILCPRLVVDSPDFSSVCARARARARDRKAYINIHSAKFSRRISYSPLSASVWEFATSSGRRQGGPTSSASHIARSYD